MITDGRVKGLPLVEYADTLANIEALTLTAADAGALAYATDTEQWGVWDGAAWVWSLPGVWSDPHDLAEVNSIQLELAPTVTPAQGLLWWNPDDGTVNVGMTDGADVIQQVGQETFFYVKNQTGSTLLNGTAIMAVGALGASGRIKADYALADGTYPARYVIGVATEDIANGADGLVTSFGLVRGIDTSGTPYSETWADGDVLYVSPTIAGGFTNVEPTAPDQKIIIAMVITAHASTGTLMVRVTHGENLGDQHNVTIGDGATGDLLRLGADGVWSNTDPVTAVLPFLGAIDNEPTGFPNRTDSALTFVDGTRTFTIAPTGTEFVFYEVGVAYTVTPPGDSLVIADTTGIHVLYYDAGTLTEAVNPTAAAAAILIRTKPLISILYWNATAGEAIYVGEERHGLTMDGVTHSYLHYTLGLAYLNGLALNSILADENGSADTHAQFGVDAGAVSDEDIYDALSAVLSTTGLPIYYMIGAGVWNRRVVAGYSVLKTGTGGEDRLAFNEFTGGSWQLTEVANNDFVLCHVFATTEKDKPIIAIVGQAEYGTLGQAQTGAETEIRELLLNDVLFPEIRPLATVIFQTSDSYSNTMHARVRSTEDGADYVDWRNETLSRVALSTDDHNSLTGLQGGAASERYHLTSAEHTEATQYASTAQAGLLTELATDAETQTGTDTERAVTPAGLRADVPATPAASRGVRLDANGDALLPSGGDVLPDGATDVDHGIDKRLRDVSGPVGVGDYGYNPLQLFAPVSTWYLGDAIRDDFFRDNVTPNGSAQWDWADAGTGPTTCDPQESTFTQRHSWWRILAGGSTGAYPHHAIAVEPVSGATSSTIYQVRLDMFGIAVDGRCGFVLMDTAKTTGCAWWWVWTVASQKFNLIYATYSSANAWLSQANAEDSNVAYTTDWTVRWTSSDITLGMVGPQMVGLRPLSGSGTAYVYDPLRMRAQAYTGAGGHTPAYVYLFAEGNLLASLNEVYFDFVNY